MKNQEIKALTEALKETAKEMIKAGYNGNQVVDAIASKFGNAVARLIMVDIALDLGMVEQSKKYLARF